MSRTPRLIPLIAVAIGGVLAINAITRGPDLLSAAKAFAEDAAAPKAGVKPAVPPNASIIIPAAHPPVAAAAKPAPPVCAPTAAELAKEAGLSPAELQVLQSLGSRRGQLDQRESDLDTQVQLIAAGEVKLDARIKELNGLKGDIQGLLSQADQQQQAEAGRLIRVYEAMAPKDAAGRLTLMDDAVRLPIAAKMKERSLAAILGKMDPEAAKILTEKLAHRLDAAQPVTKARSALDPAAVPAPSKTTQASNLATDAEDAVPDAQDAAATSKPKPTAAKPHRSAKAKPPKKPAGTDIADAKPAAGSTPAPVVAPASTPAPAKPAAAAAGGASAPAGPVPAKTG
jgi:flagellar motility protein MotE (MotC chaperone)